jgi:hypothetical protein
VVSELRIPAELDALPSVLPPEGVVVTRLGDLAARSAAQPRVDVAGVRGAADALVIASFARAGSAVVAVAEDVDAAASRRTSVSSSAALPTATRPATTTTR